MNQGIALFHQRGEIIMMEIEHKFLVNPSVFKAMYPNLKPKFLSTQAYLQVNEPNISQVRIATLTYDDYTLPPLQGEIGVINVKGIRTVHLDQNMSSNATHL